MKRFEPRLDVLPKGQKRLWPELQQIPRKFVLYGGTGISLRLAHRQSADFDFFTSDPLIPESLLGSVGFLARAKMLQREGQSLSVSVGDDEPVKVSFFGGLTMGRVQDPEETTDGVLLVASLVDLAGMKAKVVQQRAEAKDYLDLLALMSSGVELSTALGAAQALYEDQYNPLITLKALTYYGDGDLYKLTQQQKDALSIAAAQRIEIPSMSRISKQISPLSQAGYESVAAG